MNSVSYIILTIGLLGLAFGLLCALRLYHWERIFRRCRIVIAYKGKATINRPLADWAQWARSVDKDKHANGQVIYRGGHVSVAVLEPRQPTKAKTIVHKSRNSSNG